MAFDQTKPATTDNYSTQFTQGIQANFLALALWLDSTNTTITGTVPTFAKRYNRTSKFIEEYSGSAWGTLLQNISGNAATATAVGITNDVATNAAHYLLFATANTGNLPAKVASTKLSFNPSTGVLSATGFSGPLAGNATTATNVAYSGLTGTVPTWNQNTTGTAAIATAVTITNDVATAVAVYPMFATANTGNLGARVASTKMSFVPSTGILICTGFAGALTGNVTGNVTGSSGSCTGNAATASTDSQHFGVGQSWQNVTASRALGTTYTNSTGKPISIAVSMTSNASYFSISINGSAIATTGFAGGVTFVVPNGATYAIGSGPTLSIWSELR